MDITQRKKGLLLGSFVADALSLGAHWVYDVEKIKKEIPHLEKYHNPISLYHSTKKAGDFTHYGDMSLFLLSFIEEYDFDKNELFQEDITKKWSDFISNYKGYLDHSNRESLQNYKTGNIPSGQRDVHDLSPSTRIAPLIYKFADNKEKLKEYAIIQTQITNNSALCIETTTLVIDIINDILNNITPSQAIKNRLDDSNDEIKIYINMAIQSDEDDAKAIQSFGPACTIDGALSGALFFIIKYENDFKKALLQNIACGGDSSSRGMFIAMAIGAYLGDESIPNNWINDINQIDIIKKFI